MHNIGHVDIGWFAFDFCEIWYKVKVSINYQHMFNIHILYVSMPLKEVPLKRFPIEVSQRTTLKKVFLNDDHPTRFPPERGSPQTRFPPNEVPLMRSSLYEVSEWKYATYFENFVLNSSSDPKWMFWQFFSNTSPCLSLMLSSDTLTYG